MAQLELPAELVDLGGSIRRGHAARFVRSTDVGGHRWWRATCAVCDVTSGWRSRLSEALSELGAHAAPLRWS